MSDSDPNVSRPDFIDSGQMPKSPSAVKQGAAKEPQIEFLCPNGHRLHGPASLQGRPGECPECSARFRIPLFEDVSSEEQPAQEIGLGRVDAGKGSENVPPKAADEAAPSLLARLWNLRPNGAAVELRLRNGETFAPDRFLAKASRESRQGVFSTVEADGTISLVVVPWEAVDRITLRGLKEVPQELTDE